MHAHAQPTNSLGVGDDPGVCRLLPPPHRPVLRPQSQPDLLHSLPAPLGHDVHGPGLHHLSVPEHAVQPRQQVGIEEGDLIPGEPPL